MPINNWISDDEEENDAVKALKLNMISRLENEQVFVFKKRRRKKDNFFNVRLML